MISLDNVILLEQKVESAVAKIQQLQAENDALRKKCSELTNALSAKSEQLDTFTLDQNRIESGILKALNRLNSIENSVLNAASSAAAAAQVAAVKPQTTVQSSPAPKAPVQNVTEPQAATPIPAQPVANPVPETPAEEPFPVSEQSPLDSFFEGANADNIADEGFEQEESFGFFDQSMPQTEEDIDFGPEETDEKPENPGFDIF